MLARARNSGLYCEIVRIRSVDKNNGINDAKLGTTPANHTQ